MNGKRFLGMCVSVVLCAALFTGCGSSGPELDKEELSACQPELDALSVPQNVKIAGLGEASHGVSEYHQMKAEVFKALVKNNGCRSFVIEGDFGGCLKVDEYIHGGAGTAQEAVAEIGFGIYRTQELADLAEWMRDYNKEAAKGQELYFYGMDMQRYDNNKEYLFSILDEAAPELSEVYKEKFSALTDEARSILDDAVLEQSQKDVQALLEAMDGEKEKIIAVSGETAFVFARECARSIGESSELCASGADYNTLRDRHMAEKVDWFVENSGDSLIFINGHNGHIGKTSVSGYPCLGSLLTEAYGEQYFAIGTDAASTRFQSQKNSGGFEVMEVKNTNDLTKQLDNLDSAYYYLDFSAVEDHADWSLLLKEKQSITSLNVGIEGWQKLSKTFYTQTIVPAEAFDGMIIFRQVNPTTILD